MRNAIDEATIAVAHALLHEGGKSADKVDAYSLCRTVQGLCNRHKVLRALAGCSADKGDRCHGDPLVDDRDPEIALDLFSGRDQVLCECRDLVVDLFV